MNIRQAILKAADSIEQNPTLFNFTSIQTPSADCGTPGCALGWIGFHLEVANVWWKSPKFYRLLGLRSGTENVDDADQHFYDRMDELQRVWGHDANVCALTLRLYANKYHPAEQVNTGIPNSVLAIFNLIKTIGVNDAIPNER